MNRAPAVLLGATEAALAAARSLARDNITVLMVNTREHASPSTFSRFASCTNVHDPETDPENLIEDLRKICAPFTQKPVLVPTNDSTVLFISRYRTQLDEFSVSSVWCSPLFAQLGSKSDLAELRERFNLPLPASYDVDTAASLVDSYIDFPVIIKPDLTHQWFTDRARALGLNQKAIRAENAADLARVLEANQIVGGKVVVQQFVDGADSDHVSYACFVNADGSTGGELIAQKARIFPPKQGVGSYVITNWQDDIAALGRRIVRDIGFRGFLSIQFKRDRNGIPFLLEINLRFPIWTGLAVSADANFPLMYYNDAIGARNRACVRAKQGRSWINLKQDFTSMKYYSTIGAWGWKPWLATVRSANAYAYFTKDDPLPALIATVTWAKTILTRQIGRMLRTN